MKTKHPVVLLVLDGWGIAPADPGNAVTQAKTYNFNKFWASFPHTRLTASGEGVGLPSGEAGNSEVGHLNLGAGRIVYQDLVRINMAISEGTFGDIEAFTQAIDHVEQNKSDLHLMGLVGPGEVHSSTRHLLALLWLCKEKGLPQNKVKLHLFTDGRDAPPTNAGDYITQLEEKIAQLGVGEIATISGRYYAMDRDNRWDRTAKAYRALTEGIGEKTQSVTEAIQKSYTAKRTDEFILPSIIIGRNNQPKGLVKDNDAVIFFNFRPDRAVQLTEAFVLPDLDDISAKISHFDEKLPWPTEERIKVKTFLRSQKINNLFFVSMTQYNGHLPVSAVAFPSRVVETPLSAVLADHELRQLHIAETEKYFHITYFFNGWREQKYQGEDWMQVPSPKVATYDLKPEMSAQDVAKTVVRWLNNHVYDFILVNFANPDMVGHTGVIPAAISACETVDRCLGMVANTVLSLGGACVICADHGNVEEMINPATGQPDTEHSTNPVPFIVVKEGLDARELPMGILADVAPTILGLMNIPIPPAMTGKDVFS